MEDAGILLVLLGLLFALSGGGAGGGDDGGDGDSGGASSPAEGEEISPTIFDDSLDPDNGMATGTQSGDLILGSLSADGLEGFNADETFPDDTITGLGGDDTIIGGNGNDSVLGGADNDLISGGLGDDTLDGGAGDDTLASNEGSNLLTGGPGNDVFQLDYAGLDFENIPDGELPDGERNIELEGQGDGQVEVENPERLPRNDEDTISDFSNEEGNRDFIDLKPLFPNLEAAQQAYDAENNRLDISDADGNVRDYIYFDETMSAEDLTTETTGLAPNVAPVALPDNVTFILPETAGGDTVEVPVVTGALTGGPDNDPDGENSELVIRTINGMPLSDDPADPSYGIDGVQSVRTDVSGRLLFVELEAEFSFEGGDRDVAFDYTVVDPQGAESAPAQAVIAVEIDEPPVANSETFDRTVNLGTPTANFILQLVNPGEGQPEANADSDDRTSLASLDIAQINGIDVSGLPSVPLPSFPAIQYQTLDLGNGNLLQLQPNLQNVVVTLSNPFDVVGENGVLEFTYTIVDNAGQQSNEATVTLNLNIIGAPQDRV